MGYDTEATLVNLFGDEVGIGEAWDLYEAVEHPKEFFHFFGLYGSIGFAVIGILLIGLYFVFKSNHELLIAGIGFLGLGLLIFIAYHFL